MTSPWPFRNRPGDLGDAEAQLWVVALDLVPERFPGFRSILSPDEQERASRFLNSVDARRVMAARASLRSLLGSYVGIEPGQLRFIYDRFVFVSCSQYRRLGPLRECGKKFPLKRQMERRFVPLRQSTRG